MDTNQQSESDAPNLTAAQYVSLLLSLQEDAVRAIVDSSQSIDELKIKYLGRESELSRLSAQMRALSADERKQAGTALNAVKTAIRSAIADKEASGTEDLSEEWIDPSAPGTRPPEGHLHLVSQAIEEISAIFSRLGFTRVRHPEVDWDWYAFESLNMPPHHAARDEWETFFVGYPGTEKSKDPKKQTIVLTPHTSNGQVREMEKGKLPIRMINIAKCYRRQQDVSHSPMFHQFEGLYIDTNVSIGHLKGVLDYFAASFFGPARKTRIRPFHFQFTEPSFEVDVTCGVCLGKGCRLCKEGWLELGGAGMVHPNVLKNGGIDPEQYSGFAFGWGVERTYMMKAGTKLDDIRLLYSNDVRFLRQF